MVGVVTAIAAALRSASLPSVALLRSAPLALTSPPAQIGSRYCGGSSVEPAKGGDVILRVVIPAVACLLLRLSLAGPLASSQGRPGGRRGLLRRVCRWDEVWQ